MSADNYIAVKKIDDKWHVWMVLGGYEDSDWEIPRGSYHREFNDKLDALEYAHDITHEVVVEYGVCVLGE